MEALLWTRKSFSFLWLCFKIILESRFKWKCRFNIFKFWVHWSIRFFRSLNILDWCFESPYCTVLIVLYLLYCTYCTVLIVLYTYCTVLIILYLVYCTYCTVLSVLYLLYCTKCTVLIVLYLLYTGNTKKQPVLIGSHIIKR